MHLALENVGIWSSKRLCSIQWTVLQHKTLAKPNKSLLHQLHAWTLAKTVRRDYMKVQKMMLTDSHSGQHLRYKPRFVVLKPSKERVESDTSSASMESETVGEDDNVFGDFLTNQKRKKNRKFASNIALSSEVRSISSVNLIFQLRSRWT